jgi:hypothetical protein
MKKLLLLLVALLALPANAYAVSCTGAVCKTTTSIDVNSGGSLNGNSGSTVTLSGTNTIGGTINVSPITFSTALTGNPLMQLNYTDTSVPTGLTSATMATIIASTAGKTIYPGGGLTIMVSGTAATATALALECSDGRLIASWPISNLVDLKPIGIGIYTSASSADGTITTGPGLTKGCAASTAVMLSNVGSTVTTTTHVYTNIPYTVQ